MPKHRIILVHESDDPGAQQGSELGDRLGAERLAQAVISCWPDPQAQPVLVVARDAESFGHAIAHQSAPAVVLIASSGRCRRETLRLVDQLRSERLAGVLLCEHDRDGIACGGVVVMAADAPVASVAEVLHALASREEVVREIGHELSVVQRTSGGVRDEMSRLSQELSLASKIQHDLIPRRLPAVAGMDLGVLFRPAGYVSGDIYNMAMVDQRTMAFFIADAVGHGVPAALLTMIISRSLPMRGGMAEGRVITPADALGRLNDELCLVGDATPRFATAVYGLLDVPSGLVRVANAGHPKPLCISPSGLTRVEASGPLLGVFPDAEFTEETFELPRGSTLLLYSDGFESAFPSGVIGGANTEYLDHLTAVGRDARDGAGSVSDALGALCRRLDRASGSLHQADDLTAVALRRLAA
jgi:serine phosphatase RsbU (regulator of sigma subunit)